MQAVIRRCEWATLSNNPLMVKYHDKEWGVPVHDDTILFEFLVLEGAQAGLTWQTVLNKRENYRKAFHAFNTAKIARYNAKDIERLLRDSGIIRNRLKIEATITNAKQFLATRKEFRLVQQLRLAIRRRQTHQTQVHLAQPDSSNHHGVRRDEQTATRKRL